MDSNLKTGSAFKELLLKKLSYAVMCSGLSYVVVVFVYIFVVKFEFELLQWLKNSFSTLTSFSTWMYLIPFCCIIFAQIMICAKDYVLRNTYQLSRFKKIVSIFSVRTFMLGLLHVVVGGVVIWLYLSLSGGPYESLIVKCKDEEYCLVEGNFYLILSGLWTGLYFFLRVYIADKTLLFPVIQQRKLLHFKAKFMPLLRESKNIAIVPAISYCILYWLLGSHIRNTFMDVFNLKLQQNHDFNIALYLYLWLFSTLYIFNLHLTRFFFDLFLTEPVEHPIMATYGNNASLSEALLLNTVPILQHLACLDLYLLSVWSRERRQALFVLSQPGGHPHTWNRLFQAASKLIIDFTATLSKSTDALQGKPEEQPVSTSKTQIFSNQSLPALSHFSQPKHRCAGLRNMSSCEPIGSIAVVNVTHRTDNTDSDDVLNDVNATPRKTDTIFQNVKGLRVVKYVFGELPEIHIQQCLKNGQIIVWTVLGLSNVAVASFNEDPYGVVQKDLPLLITNLVQLKQCIDKLNKVPMFSRKGQSLDEFSFTMKNSVHSAIKRSLCNICTTFGKYLNDIPLNKDVAAQLQYYF